MHEDLFDKIPKSVPEPKIWSFYWVEVKSLVPAGVGSVGGGLLAMKVAPALAELTQMPVAYVVIGVTAAGTLLTQAI